MGSRLEQKSSLVRKRIEQHNFDGEDGEEYEASKFAGFPEYFRRKKIKLQNLDAELRARSTDKAQIFKGIVCHVNGYTQPSLNDLHRLIVQHGGGFIQYLDGKTMVTHIIASNLTPKKKEEFKRYRIVKPAWITDSVSAGKLLPWDVYRVVDEGVGQKLLGFENGQVVSQANKKGQGYKEQTDTSWYTSQLKANDPQNLATACTSPSSAQMISAEDEIDDEEYAMSEITSSIERALDQHENLDHNPKGEEDLVTPRELLEIRTEIEVPPPTSPLSVRSHSQDMANVPMIEDEADNESGDGDFSCPIPVPKPWNEAEYSAAIVRNSEVVRAVSPSRLRNMTAEEYNSLLLSDPHIRKSTVVHPGFLDQYYRESRLHHLSAWKAELKSQLQALAAETSLSQKVKLKKLPGQRRYIMHVDFDSFFAAVSLKKYPQYKDKPVVVAHGAGSGSEIASCNYPARKFGIRNGMWMKRAQEVCPDVKILPYDFPAYEEASRKFYEIILATGGVVQSVSIDEALIDASAICIAEGGTDGVNRNEGAVDREQDKADTLARTLRAEVLERSGCNVSVGVGGNILLAKIALRKAKPAGQFQLKPEDVLETIAQLEVQQLPGVAWSIGGKLEELQIKLVKDIRAISKEKLMSTLGPKTGERIWDYSRGIDKTEVGDQVVRKSVSAEVNWGVRFENQEQVDEFMHGLCGELHKRLVKERVKGRQLTIKVMRRAADAPRDPPKHLGHGKCDTFNKSLQLGFTTNDTEIIAKEAVATLRTFNITPGELRGIGVQMQKLDPVRSGPGGANPDSQKRLQFKIEPSIKQTFEKTTEKVGEDPIHDDGDTPKKHRIAHAEESSVKVNSVTAGTPSKRSLNTLGTQFILPTQVDPSVLAELPEDIRAKLTRSVKPTLPLESEIETSMPISRSQSPAPPVGFPTQSQIDPSILEALPEDVRAEILGLYKSPSKRGGQALLPQSPRKTRMIPTSKMAGKQPVRRKRGGGLFAGHTHSNVHSAGSSTLTQSNFVARPNTKRLHDDGGATIHTETEPEPETEDLDPEVLAALPEDIRREVLAQQRQSRLQRTGGIDLSLHQKSKARKTKTPDDEGNLDRLLQLPPRPPKPSFTSRKLTELPDLRDAIKAWHREFAKEEPYDEDVAALVKYLRDVVREEMDMAKATAVVNWMAWVMEDDRENVSGIVREAWWKALKRVEAGVQDAVTGRGLGKVEFG